MKKLILSIGVLSSVAAMAQTGNVGINTSTPAATLDVVGQPANASKLDGIIAPRLAGAELRAKTYTAAQTGALVYATAADTAPAGQTVNVTSAGYYYFDGSVWVKTGGSGATVPTGPTNGNFWGLTGNAGTVTGTNFLGTTDDVALQFRVNNTQGGFISRQANLNTAFGNNAAPWMTTPNGNNSNTAIGAGALATTPSAAGAVQQNVAVGTGAMAVFNNGGTNTAVGPSAMSLATQGGSNVGVGLKALNNLTAAGNSFNIGIGYLGGSTLTGGKHNVLIGSQTVYGATMPKSGDNNVYIGHNAGQGSATGSNNIALGTGVGSVLADASNQLSIGTTIYGTGLNSTDTKIGIVTSPTNVPTENFDVNGTARVRNLPTNGATNAIYTSGAITTTATKANTFTATRTVVADNNGVLGYVDGLPLTANSNNSRYISRTNTVAIQPTDGTLFINRPNGNTVNIALPTAIDNKNRIISVCAVNYNSNAQVVISNISTLQISGGSTVLNSTSGNRCLRFQSGASAEDNSAYAWYIISRY